MNAKKRLHFAVSFLYSQYLYIKLPPGLRIDKYENALSAAACAVKAVAQNSAPALGRSIAKLRIRNAQRFRDRARAAASLTAAAAFG